MRIPVEKTPVWELPRNPRTQADYVIPVKVIIPVEEYIEPKPFDIKIVNSVPIGTIAIFPDGRLSLQGVSRIKVAKLLFTHFL